MMSNKDKFYDWNRAFIQMIMSRGCMSGPDVFIGVKNILEVYKGHRACPFSAIDVNSKADVAEMLQMFLEEANDALDVLQFKIETVQEEVKSEPEQETYSQYYVLMPTIEVESVAKLQRNYGEPELEWLKLAVTHLVEVAPDHTATTNELTNLCREGGNNTQKRKLNVTDADNALHQFTEDFYLSKVRQGRKGFKYGVGPRFLAEMDVWMKDTFGDGIWTCAVCDKTGVIGVQCPKRECETWHHRYCVDRPGKPLKACARCKTPLKLEGVASKRS